MTDLRFTFDDGLEAALRDLSAAIDWPTAARPAVPDLATRVGQAVKERPAPQPSWRERLGLGSGHAGRRPQRVRWALVLAVVALLIVAVAVVGTVGFGWNGFRIVFGDAPPATLTPSPGSSSPAAASPSVSLGPPGSGLGLGVQVDLAELNASGRWITFTPTYPVASDLGPPDAAYVRSGWLSLVWAPRPGYPATLNTRVGLLISEIPGRVDSQWVQKLIHGDTRVSDVTVAGQPGYWIEGDPHFFMVVGPDGREVDVTRRAVGDSLVWTAGGITYRIESSIGREATIRLAESLR